MAKVNIVQKKVKMGLVDIIKYQLMTHCFIKNITLSSTDIDCLAELAIMQEAELNIFCKHIYDKKIFKSAQTVRNSLNKAEKLDLIVKRGRNKKIINMNPEINIQSTGNILLDYKLFTVES